MRSGKVRCAGRVTVSGFVESLDEITCLLEFDRQKVSRRDIDAFGFDASRVVAARSNLVGPEGQPARIRFAIEEVQIMLPHEKLRRINRIQPCLVAIENSISVAVDAQAASRADGHAQKSQLGSVSGRLQKR